MRQFIAGMMVGGTVGVLAIALLIGAGHDEG